MDDIEELVALLEDEGNDNILKYTNTSIKRQKNQILQELGLPRETMKRMHKKLQDYRYVLDLADIRYGSYIRWIPLKNPERVYLTTGGIVLDIKILDCIHIVCKNNRNQLFQIKFDEVLIFQKISDQEQLVLNILDFIKKHNIDFHKS